jgi:hypothetical protein
MNLAIAFCVDLERETFKDVSFVNLSDSSLSEERVMILGLGGFFWGEAASELSNPSA